jgi:hypothetical protein
MSVYSEPSRQEQAHGAVAPRGRWQDWVNLILGVWLFFSPWIYHRAAGNFGWNDWVLGVIVFIVALWAIGQPTAAGAEWVNTIAGAWLFISPWALGFSRFSAGAWNDWIVGIVVFILAIWASSILRGTIAGGPNGTSANPVS